MGLHPPTHGKVFVGWISVAHPPCRPLVDALRLSTLLLEHFCVSPEKLATEGTEFSEKNPFARFG